MEKVDPLAALKFLADTRRPKVPEVMDGVSQCI